MALTKFIAAGFLVLVLAPVAANAQIADGGFEAKGNAGTIENGGAPVNRYCYDGANFGNGSCAATANWSGSGVVASHNGDWGGTAAQSGDYFAFVQGGQALSQTFSIGTAGSFDISWFDAGRTNNGGPQSYTVSLFDGTSSLLLGTFMTDHFDWVGQSSGKLALGAGNYTLTFQGLSNEDRTSFIDGVSIAAVPEPAAWGMLIGGFGLAGSAMRRRRNQGALSAA